MDGYSLDEGAFDVMYSVVLASQTQPNQASNLIVFYRKGVESLCSAGIIQQPLAILAKKNVQKGLAIKKRKRGKKPNKIIARYSDHQHTRQGVRIT